MQKIIDQVKTIGIMGLAKNTGKTTTLNYIIQLSKQYKIGLTSIGLDGEDLDQINFLPKPKIEVREGMVVATTQSCLDQSMITYKLLKKVDIFTALGPIRLVEVTSSGQVVVAGPTTNQELKLLISIMKPYVDRLLIDGAFNRMTFANLDQIDGLILATGASVHPVMQKTIERTKAVVESFQLNQSTLYQKIPHAKMVIHDVNQVHLFKHKNYDVLTQVLNEHHHTIRKIYIQGAITPKIVELFIDKQIHDIELIVDDPTKFLISDRYYEHLKKLKIQLSVINPTKLLCITVNPFRPTGDSYDAELLLEEMQKAVSLPVFNVLKKEVQHVKT